jgi:alpha-glucosidase (family GH31 glycosyl hydrolase)
VFPDWTHRSASSWMAECLDDFRKTVPYDGIWFDMNEPASFATGYDLNVLPTDSHDVKRAKLSRISQWRGKEILHLCEGEDWRERKKVETAMALERSKIRGGDNGLDYPPYRVGLRELSGMILLEMEPDRSSTRRKGALARIQCRHRDILQMGRGCTTSTTSMKNSESARAKLLEYAL